MQPHYQDDTLTIFHGDCRDVLMALPAESVQCIVTSPPYFHARDYGEPRQIGLEPTPAGYVGAICDAVRGMRHVLRPDGVLWLNLGDCYAQDSKWGGKSGGKNYTSALGGLPKWRMESGLPDKNLIGIPWRVPEARARKADQLTDAGHHTYANLGNWEPTPLRRARTIWRIPTTGNRDAHYAVFPEALAERCILASSRPGDVVLDPFGGSGTTARVAERLGRKSILIDLNSEYLEIQQRRTSTVQRAMEAYL